MTIELRVLLSASMLMILSAGFLGCGGTANNSLSQEESNQRLAAATTHVTAVGLGEILKGVTDENQRINTIRNFIDPIRFFDDQSGYFYVYYYNCVNVAHAIDKSLLGKDFTDYKDMKGQFVIRELSAKAKSGGGYVTFYWPHPQTKAEQKKYGYVEPIPNTNYFIGTGYYPDTK